MVVSGLVLIGFRLVFLLFSIVFFVLSLLNLTGLRREEFIHFSILGKMVLKGDDGVAEEQESFAGTYIGHVG